MGNHAPQQARARETRARLLRSGAETLERRGPEGLTVRLVAQQAGVSVGTLYRYFGSKEGLLLSLSRKRASARWTELLRRAREMSHLPIHLAIDQWTRHEIAYRSQREVSRQDFHPQTAELRRLLLQQVIKTLDERAETRGKNTELAATLWIDGLDAIVRRFAWQHPELLRDPRFAKELADLFQRYLIAGRDPGKIDNAKS